MSKKEKYYGIYLNDDIPKIDKVNKYSKEVEVKFEGKAYLIERDDDGEIQKREELYTEDKLRKEKDYEIEFINEKNEIYYIQVRIESSYLFIILLLFLLGFLIGLILTRPVKDGDSILDRFYNFISLSVIDLSIDGNEPVIEKSKKPEKKYDFDVTFKNISSDDINLTNSISGKAIAKNKIAPGVSGSFSIVLNTKKSTVDMKYKIGFVDITNEKPNNMLFKIRGNDKTYSSLQQLQNDLNGTIKARSTKEIIIDWQWAYETGNSEDSIVKNDKIDTFNGKVLESYKYRINVIGEEAI